MEDIVATAGGWICDRAMSGWEVTVATRDESENPEPLKMLGACGIGLGSADLERRGPWPHALAISPVLYESAEEVQSGVRRALRQGTPTITLLGTKTWPDGLENEMRLVQHPVSGGARRFKACALSALSSQRDAYEPEVFLSGELNTYTPWSHDLMPV